MNFSDQQIERYSRHIILQEVGVEGQEKLLTSKVLVIGTGGLGAPAAMFLAAAGVGTIGLADGDKVDLSNLQRQIIHQTKDIGKLKVLSGEETIREMNPDINVVTYNTFVNSSNILDMIKDQDYDFIIDGTDNFAAKFLINDACVLAQKPFSHAGIIRFEGQLITFIPGKSTPCYRCIFKEPPPEGVVPTCREAGVLGVMGGVVGTLQATEAIKYIVGIGEPLAGYLLTYNALTMEFRKIRIRHNEKCGVCGNDPHIKSLIDYKGPVCDLASGTLEG
ncbi:MAG: HesA/MoeB/ThiF family protein [Bacillota bacterium]